MAEVARPALPQHAQEQKVVINVAIAIVLKFITC